MISRTLKAQEKLKEKSFDAILVSSIPNITYLTGFSGFSKDEREAFMLITKNKQYILTDKRYIDEIKPVLYASSEQQRVEKSSVISSRQARTINYFELIEVSYSLPFFKALEKLIKKHLPAGRQGKIKKLGIETNNLTVNEYVSLRKIFKSKSALISYNISENRIVKEQIEIDSIKKACSLTDRTFEHILKKIKPGISEKELAFEIEMFIKKHGGDLAFESIVAFGKHSAVPHHKPGNQRSKIKDQILLDFGAKIDNYCSDMTRVVFLGKATNEQKKVYETVLEAQKRAMDYISSKCKIQSSKLEIEAADVDKAAHDYIRQQGFGDNIFHSLGHGVGLEIHEAPRLSPKSKEVLKPGMVFTIEPGIYLPAGRQGLPNKFGIRIEDTVVLQENGLKILTHSPKEIIEL